MSSRRVVASVTTLVALGLVVSGCSTSTSDWGDKFQDTINDMNLFGTAKKPLPGERREVFPGGAVPGVSQGVPPDLMPGAQQANVAAEPPPAQPAPAQAVPPPAKKKKKVAAVKRPRPAQPPPAANESPDGVWPAPPAQSPPPPPADSVWPPPPR